MGQVWRLFLGLRPRQWLKNVLLFAGLIFAEKLTDITLLSRVVQAFVSFCLLSGSIYLFNDIRDVEQDRQHPEKKNRPLASGALKMPVAQIGALIAGTIGLAWSFLISFEFGLCGVVYLIMTVSYTLGLKHVAIIDIMILSFGFVLRAYAGIAAVNEPTVPATPWFLTCVWFLALFIVICKRRHEIGLLQEGARNHRAVLEEYSTPFLDQLVSITTTGTIMAYALYAINNDRHHGIVWTVVFVVYGIFRYLHAVYHQNQGGAPEMTVLRDKTMVANVILWLASMIYIFYFQK
ncbi:decaprenyl-phosphate phosphoribosyltransferase [Candidatus Sumerlaeota bacterium]|nr:decaprenyl-phosphate phosphoribosyltransferase [Candidatus Sumerlaeota bacterium]